MEITLLILENHGIVVLNFFGKPVLYMAKALISVNLVLSLDIE